MDMKHFGDSYDVVKKSLIAWLVDLGPWSAHPMFTHVNPAQAQNFERFLGVRLLSRELLHSRSDRTRYFNVCETAQNVFLDPTTGLKVSKVSKVSASKKPYFLLSKELVQVAKKRPEYLTLTFDQSFNKASKIKPQIREKLRHFAKKGLHGFAYVSHASFIIFGCRRTMVKTAYKTMLEKSGLPVDRFVRNW